ncbi:MAG: GNAT family protein [Melioribacteraceae bacterium]|jgi:diamine N-acetyltransferase|nr:GNAT family protein [Melioribacteraceae bacterium]
MEKTIKNFEGNNVYLRPYCEASDLDLFHLGENNAEVRDSLFLHSPLTKINAKEKITEWISKIENKIFTICESETNIPIGITGLFRIDHISRSATFYIAIYNPLFWSKGYGKETTKLVLKYSFDVLNLNRIQLHVASSNIKGIKAYKNAGFLVEGTLREAMYHNNEYVDFYVMGILRKEFYEMLEK